MLKEELIQVHEILVICCLDLPASDYESVRIYILYTIFEDGMNMDCCRVSTIFTQMHRKS